MLKTHLIFLSTLLFIQIHIATANPECDSTWKSSSAALTCGKVCTNPQNVYHYAFSSHFNTLKNECTFNAGCCQGFPMQICSYQWAVCDPTSITVKKGDGNFYNNHGQLRHN